MFECVLRVIEGINYGLCSGFRLLSGFRINSIVRTPNLMRSYQNSFNYLFGVSDE